MNSSAIAADIVVLIVSTVDSDADLCSFEIALGLERLPENVTLGDAIEEEGDDKATDDGDNGNLLGSLEGTVQDANAARCNGRQPWRDSLKLAASG